MKEGGGEMRLKISFAVLLCLALLGCGGGGGGDNSPPSATGTFSRTDLPFGGGTVQITVTVNDPSGVAFAEVDISPRLQGFVPIALSVQNQKTVTSTVTISLPLNSGVSDAVYRVTVKARDALGNEGTVVIGTITVRSPLSALPSLPNPSGAFAD